MTPTPKESFTVTAVDITGLDKADVLAALYNNSQPLGLPSTGHSIAGEAAQRILDERGGLNIDYVAGRVIKVDLSSDSFDPDAYDCTNGDGAAARVIGALRSLTASKDAA